MLQPKLTSTFKVEFYKPDSNFDSLYFELSNTANQIISIDHRSYDRYDEAEIILTVEDDIFNASIKELTKFKSEKIVFDTVLNVLSYSGEILEQIRFSDCVITGMFHNEIFSYKGQPSTAVSRTVILSYKSVKTILN